MPISTVLSEIVSAIEGSSVSSGKSWSHVEAYDLEQSVTDRTFTLTPIERRGRRQTGATPLIDFTVLVELLHRPGQFSMFADIQRVGDEASAIARLLEQSVAWAGDSAVLVEVTSFDFGEVAHITAVQLQVTLRE